MREVQQGKAVPLLHCIHPSRAQPATTLSLVVLISPPTRAPRTQSTAPAPMSSTAARRPGPVNRSTSAIENMGRTAFRTPGLAASEPAFLGRGTGGELGTVP